MFAAAPGWAAASMRQESIMEDTPQLLASGSARQAAVLDEMRALGVDTVRALVFWRDVAGPRRGMLPPAAFDRWDDLVRGAHARGMKVLLTPTSPIPGWASGCRPAGPACTPDPKLYGAFVRALGARYSGRHRDENQGRRVLPRVDRWSLWNEPNLPSWLRPQFAKDGTDIGADAYRALAQAGIRALRATGHAHDTILLGETAPVGRTLGPPATRPAAPVTFLRRLFCLDGGHCPRLRVSGYAHHPYTQGAHAAPFSPTAPGQISFTNAAVLKRLLRDGARAGAIPPRLPIWWTEFGYQTSPPDPVLGVPLAAQAEFLNFFDFLAARDPRVRAVSQYELVDDDARDGFQTGLRRFGSLAVKPAYGAYRLPLWVERRKRTVRVYGQLRPAPAGSRQTVVLQRSAAPGKPWLHAARFGVATRTHQFLHDVPYRRGVWRLKWGGFYSRAAVAHVP